MHPGKPPLPVGTKYYRAPSLHTGKWQLDLDAAWA
jgi:hypothetical protein